MAELAAAESMEELLVTMIWQVIDKVRGEAIMRGPSGVEIQVVENHARPCDVRQGNIVDWSFVRRVKITSIQVKS
ncbi:hypothetical protein VB738_11085 [Cyanobium gracile UHCC 0139]|uniref:Uncharacterized protein n=1 Tax=Cyanobium gracile UHCC 0139 TaxID=3110308 RepID=A0ABU5RVI1_9CYAN|nr:hypothetical protein [Cyanobium gracile]MEA5391799.1 hypothetical protein [Cyanobium gracile UHCC 0139]